MRRIIFIFFGALISGFVTSLIYLAPFAGVVFGLVIIAILKIKGIIQTDFLQNILILFFVGVSYVLALGLGFLGSLIFHTSDYRNFSIAPDGNIYIGSLIGAVVGAYIILKVLKKLDCTLKDLKLFFFYLISIFSAVLGIYLNEKNYLGFSFNLHSSYPEMFVLWQVLIALYLYFILKKDINSPNQNI